MFWQKRGPATLTAKEALEKVLCFGWIDGQMKKIDARSYQKYFGQRRPNSKWSAKNKALAEKLQASGQMTKLGQAKIAEAQANGQWQQAQPPTAVTSEQVAELAARLQVSTRAYENFTNLSPSVQKTYTRAYFDAKTPTGRPKRLAWLMDRVERNLPPM